MLTTLLTILPTRPPTCSDTNSATYSFAYSPAYSLQNMSSALTYMTKSWIDWVLGLMLTTGEILLWTSFQISIILCQDGQINYSPPCNAKRSLNMRKGIIYCHGKVKCQRPKLLWTSIRLILCGTRPNRVVVLALSALSAIIVIDLARL